MASGAAAGLELADALVDEPSLRKYHLLQAVRGDLLERLGRRSEAREAFEQAAAQTMNRRERELMLGRARQCADRQPPA
jgi:predicted RNA polymerase sigma factor